MIVLLGCEESQAVCIEFRKRGHEAYSCDLQPCSGGHPEWHFQMDIFKVIQRQPDLFSDNVTHVSEGESLEWTDKKTGKKKRQPLWYANAKQGNDLGVRSKERSKTFGSIAKAFAEQWG